MKICIITYAYSPDNLGGADRRMEERAEELHKRGHEVFIITINTKFGKEVEERNGIRIYRFHPLNFSTFHKIGKKSNFKKVFWSIFDIYDFYSKKRIKKILKKEKPDVAHIITPIGVTMSAFDALKKMKIPTVFTLADYLVLCKRITLIKGSGELCNEKNIHPICKSYRKFNKKILENSISVVTSPSKFVLKLYKKERFFKNIKSMVIPNSVDLAEAKIKKNKKNKKIKFLYVGGLTYHKGVQNLINSFREIKNNNLLLEIVGDGIYRNELEKLAGEDKRIIFHGKLPYKKTQEFYEKVDFLVVPSIWYEVFGTIILESFRKGTPVIGARIGAIPELIRENETGFLFNAGDEKDLRRSLEKAITNINKIDKLNKNSFDFVKKFNMEAHMDNLLKAYKEAIKENKK